MTRVMIKCPNTGKAVPTGKETNEATLERVVFFDNILFDCPACGENHTWDTRDAWLESPSRKAA